MITFFSLLTSGRLVVYEICGTISLVKSPLSFELRGFREQSLHLRTKRINFSPFHTYELQKDVKLSKTNSRGGSGCR